MPAAEESIFWVSTLRYSRLLQQARLNTNAGSNRPDPREMAILQEITPAADWFAAATRP
jgi:hypothetical protein